MQDAPPRVLADMAQCAISAPPVESSHLPPFEQGSADLLFKVRGFSLPQAQKPQTSAKRGLRYTLNCKDE